MWQVAALAAPAFQQLMSTLAFGLTAAATDAEVATSTIDAIAALARFHFSAAQAGAPGLTAHVAEGAPGGLFSHFLELLLRALLFDACRRDFAEQAADALLPLILCEPQVCCVCV